MTATAYAPFPELELKGLADHCDRLAEAAILRNNPAADAVVTILRDRADMLRNAIASHEALRERCLLAELQRDHGVTTPEDSAHVV